VSGNPGGRPKLLGDSYKAMLATDLTTHAFVQPFLLEQVLMLAQ